MRAQRPQALSPAEPHSPPSPGSGAARGPKATSDAAGGGQGPLVGLSGGGPKADPGEVFPAPRSAHETLGAGRGLGENRDVALPSPKSSFPGLTARAPSSVCKGWGPEAGQKPPTWRGFLKVR